MEGLRKESSREEVMYRTEGMTEDIIMTETHTHTMNKCNSIQKPKTT